MSAESPSTEKKGLAAELRSAWGRWRQVWALVSKGRRRTLSTARIVMIVTSLANALVPIWLGGLVDAMQGREAADLVSRAPLEVSGADDDFEWRPAGGAIEEPTSGLPSSLLYRVAGVYLACIAAAYILREGLGVLRKYLVENTCTRIEKETTVSLVSHLLKVDLTTLSRERVGALHGRIHRSIEGFVRFIKLWYMDFYPAIFTAGFALAAALVKQPWVALLMAGVIPASMFITARQLISQKGIRVDLMRSREAMDGTVVEQLGGIEYIRAANTHELEAARVGEAAESRRRKEIGHHVAMSLFDCGKALNEGLFHILVIALAIVLATRQPPLISMGDILTFSILFLSVMTPLREIHRIVDDAHESSLQVADLMAMLDTPVDKSFSLPTLRRPQLTLGSPLITAEDLQVDYRTADGRLRRGLDGISLAIRHGETIGAAGPAGSGKSTWLKVVMRLIHPSGGRVVLGGEPIEAISRELIGQLVGYVSQIPFVFAGTVAENIAYGSPAATPDQIERAARMACIHDEILEMPGGYQAHVAERGQNLSGGQRQRLALARIFLKNPPILILDEGTSALDNINEREVQRAIAAAREDRTVIMVAHRLTTLRDADRILVFEKGKIVEEGPYDDLLARGGLFTELVHSAGGAA
jgi:ATP-binding cassette subfamily B protein